MNSLDELKQKWRSVDCVCFDVDSTVCINEAIDDLAHFLGVGEEVEALTFQAMGGNMTFKEALRRRLDIIKPTVQQIDTFNSLQTCILTPGIEEIVNCLHKRNIPVYLVSGGFRSIINPIADKLSINRQNVFANKFIFNDDGTYKCFDETEFTCESGGKPRAIEHLKKQFNYTNLFMIGDGATDLESCPPADGFIGFGGNVVREKVFKNSVWFVYSFLDLINELNK